MNKYFKLRIKASTIVDVWYWVGMKDSDHLFHDNDARKFKSKEEISDFLKKRNDVCAHQISETIIGEIIENK